MTKGQQPAGRQTGALGHVLAELTTVDRPMNENESLVAR